MNLIQTYSHAGANTFEYLVAIQKNVDNVLRNPEQWLPRYYELGVA